MQLVVLLPIQIHLPESFLLEAVVKRLRSELLDHNNLGVFLFSFRSILLLCLLPLLQELVILVEEINRHQLFITFVLRVFGLHFLLVSVLFLLPVHILDLVLWRLLIGHLDLLRIFFILLRLVVLIHLLFIFTSFHFLVLSRVLLNLLSSQSPLHFLRLLIKSELVGHGIILVILHVLPLRLLLHLGLLNLFLLFIK